MELYLVIDRENEESMNDLIYGVFSTKEQAEKVKNQFNQNFIEHNENGVVDIIELTLDKVTDDYNFIMFN